MVCTTRTASRISRFETYKVLLSKRLRNIVLWLKIDDRIVMSYNYVGLQSGAAKMLEKIQKRFHRIICWLHLRWFSIDGIKEDDKVNFLQQRVQSCCILLVHSFLFPSVSCIRFFAICTNCECKFVRLPLFIIIIGHLKLSQWVWVVWFHGTYEYCMTFRNHNVENPKQTHFSGYDCHD